MELDLGLLHTYVVKYFTSRGLARNRGKLNLEFGKMEMMPTLPPTKLLYEYEDSLRSCKNLSEIHSILTLAGATFSENVYWLDWVRVLAAHRAFKLGHKTERSKLLNSTDFGGYHVWAKPE